MAAGRIIQTGRPSAATGPHVGYQWSALNFKGTKVLCTVKPVRLATLVIRPPVIIGHTFMEPGISYDIIHGGYPITWPPAYLESCPQFHV